MWVVSMGLAEGEEADGCCSSMTVWVLSSPLDIEDSDMRSREECAEYKGWSVSHWWWSG